MVVEFLWHVEATGCLGWMDVWVGAADDFAARMSPRWPLSRILLRCVPSFNGDCSLSRILVRAVSSFPVPFLEM